MSDENTNEGIGTNSDSPAPVASEQPTWFLDDKTPGQGERPEWLPPKYKSAAELGKAYKEAEKRLGAFTGAPETYDLKSLEIDESQLLIQEMVAVGKELNMSQEGLAKFIGRIATASETMDEAYLNEQVSKLGKDGEAELLQYQNTIKDKFAPEQAEVVKEWIKTADDLKTFNQIMANSLMSVPTGNTVALANAHESVADLRSEMTANIDKYNTDAKYRANYSKRLANAVAREKR